MAKNPPHIHGYHAHIYFDSNSRESAAQLHSNAFHELAGRARVHGLIDEPIGPHPLPMFEVDITVGHFEAVKSWLARNHGPHSVLIHPITGDDLADHRDYPQWLGTPLKLDLEFLKGL